MMRHPLFAALVLAALPAGAAPEDERPVEDAEGGVMSA